MTKASFMDTILNRPSQRYTEPLGAKPSKSARSYAPSDLPNAPNKPDSILAGNMFKRDGPGSLSNGRGVYSQTPSVMSGKTNTSRFSVFRKKGRQPSISGGSVYHDGASSVAPSDMTSSPKKARWWEAGSLTRKQYSRPPSVTGSVFSEPEAAGPRGFPHMSNSLRDSAAPRGAHSDYGGPTTSRIRYSSQPAPPPVPQLVNKGSMSSMRRHSGVAPLGQQAPNLMRQASSTSLARSGSLGVQNFDPARPVSPSASMGRSQSQSRASQSGSADWNTFVKAMAGTEVAKTWETMPTWAPKRPKPDEKRSSMVASRVKKELDQDAQFQQNQRDATLVHQDLLARAASQVIGEMPPTPISPFSEPQLSTVHLQPGQYMVPISPIYSPVASSSSVNLAQQPTSMSVQASAVMYGTGSPVALPQLGSPVPLIHVPQQQEQQQPARPLAVTHAYVGAGPVAATQSYAPESVTIPSPPPNAILQNPTHHAYAPVAVPLPTLAASPSPASAPDVTRSLVAQPPISTHYATTLPSSPNTAVSRLPAQPADVNSTATLAPTTAQYLADRVEEEELAQGEATPEGATPDESEESDASLDDGIAGVGHPTLDIVAEEEEEGSSTGHNLHHEMRAQQSIKGKGPNRNYDDYEARLHLRQASAQSQGDEIQEGVVPLPTSDEQVHVTEPPRKEEVATVPDVAEDAEQLPATLSKATVDIATDRVPMDAAEPTLEKTPTASLLPAASDRPKLASRNSEVSEYQSATSGRSTPIKKLEAETEAEEADEDASTAGSADHVQAHAERSRESLNDDTASVAASVRPSIRTSRSSRPGTLPRRLSEVSLGTSFAVSGIFGRSTSSMRQRRLGDGDSDSDIEVSDDDAELRAKALAEQERLRRMNVGEDFFGPSLSSVFDKFGRFSRLDTTVNILAQETQRPSSSAAQVSIDAPADATSAVVATAAEQDVDSAAQGVINEVRQKRAETNATNLEGKRRNSADTGLAPSFAAIWLLNQTQGSNSPSAEQNANKEADGTAFTASSWSNVAPKDVASLANGSSPEKVSVLNRPRPRSKRPNEMGGVAISEGRLEADKPRGPAEDTRSTLPMSVSQPSVGGGSTGGTPIKATPLVASKDRPAPAKSAMKPKATRSLADTLFGIQFRSSGKDKEKKEKKDKEKKDKKDKKDKSKHERGMSIDSVESSIRSDRSSIIESLKRRSSSSDPASVSAIASPAASGPTSPSAKVLGKLRAVDDARTLEASDASGDVMTSDTGDRFVTPSQSGATLDNTAGVEASPKKYHTARDLKALADTVIPTYPVSQRDTATAPDSTGAMDTRPEHQRKLSEQMKSMDGFGSFALPNFESPKVPVPVAKSPEAAVKNDEALQAPSDAVAPEAATSVDATSSTSPAPVQASSVEDAVSVENSAPPTSSEASVASTALTSPEAELVSKPTEADKAVVTEVATSRLAPSPSAMTSSQKKLPLPPTPTLEDVMTAAYDDRTPTGKPRPVQGVGINLIPPTPPALESRGSYTSSKVPGTPTIAEHDDIASQRPPLMSRSSSQRTAGKTEYKPVVATEALSRSKSLAPSKKGVWQEYKGKGLTLPAGLVATTIDSSQLRRLNSQSKKAQPAAPVVGQVVDSPPRPLHTGSSSNSKSKRPGPSPSPFPQAASTNRIMMEAPPVPPVPVGYQGAGSMSSSSSHLYAYSAASSEQGWDSRSVSPSPSAVRSQSGLSVGSHVSSSVHSASYRSSLRPEFTYVNHHELSPYAKKMRALSSPSPALPTLAQTGNRHSLMSAINEWESQVPENGEVAMSSYPSRSASPNPYPPLPASTISRGSSVVSAVSSPAVVRNAPLGASTNQYLHPPVLRSRASADELPAAVNPAVETVSQASPVGRDSGPSSVAGSSPSASQSALSLSSTIPTSMPTVPTSYRPNKDPKRFSTNVDDLLNNRTTMQTVAVTSGAFAKGSRSVVKRKKSVDLNGDRRSSSDLPEHPQDELSLTTLSITAHTPPPRKIGSHQVLVQVIAVAIDETDKLILREKVRGEGAFGFVPGRSFCGRVVECGYEVKKMRKGDVVFGLQDSGKSGALAEFMVVDDNRICHAPSDCLTTEQIAALPSAGVMAHQLVQNHCSQLQRGARVLILNAHDGVGLLTMQESVALGIVIVAQCPPSISDGVAVCQANGAHEVVIGEPLWAINSLHESSFDLIVDTVGGRKVYDASRRILAFEGQFCTCYGDEHSTSNPNLKSHFRSLRRAFFKKDKKNIGYEWVGVDNGEDCKQALEAVKRAAEEGSICPRLRSILPFADAPRAFDSTTRASVNDEPGAIVVRVS